MSRSQPAGGQYGGFADNRVDWSDGRVRVIIDNVARVAGREHNDADLMLLVECSTSIGRTCCPALTMATTPAAAADSQLNTWS